MGRRHTRHPQSVGHLQDPPAFVLWGPRKLLASFYENAHDRGYAPLILD